MDLFILVLKVCCTEQLFNSSKDKTGQHVSIISINGLFFGQNQTQLALKDGRPLSDTWLKDLFGFVTSGLLIKA